MKSILGIIVAALLVAALLIGGGCRVGRRNVEKTKELAPSFLAGHGFKVVAYQGYQYGPFSGGTVWYTLEKGNITYECAVKPWFGELHLYSLKAIDAIKP